MEASLTDVVADIPGIVIYDDKVVTERDSKVLESIENWIPIHRSKDFLPTYDGRRSAVDRASKHSTPKRGAVVSTESTSRKRKTPSASNSSSSS